jgi:hypothetical protein
VLSAEGRRPSGRLEMPGVESPQGCKAPQNTEEGAAAEVPGSLSTSTGGKGNLKLIVETALYTGPRISEVIQPSTEELPFRLIWSQSTSRRVILAYRRIVNKPAGNVRWNEE